MTDISDFMPKIGNRLEGQGIELVVEAVNSRRNKFPDEPLEMTLQLVLMNIGARFDPIQCVEGEWKGYKKDVASSEGDPKCPYGHDLVQSKRGLTLGWVLQNRD